MNDPRDNPPIPSPTERPRPGAVIHSQKEWKNAPQIVKGWAYVLNWFSIILIPLAALVTVVGEDAPEEPVIKGIMVFLYFISWMIAIWHSYSLKRGASYAWTTQIVLSILGFCAVPLGTVLNLYILSQWFKPETKRWFGKV